MLLYLKLLLFQIDYLLEDSQVLRGMSGLRNNYFPYIRILCPALEELFIMIDFFDEFAYISIVPIMILFPSPSCAANSSAGSSIVFVALP